MEFRKKKLNYISKFFVDEYSSNIRHQILRHV